MSKREAITKFDPAAIAGGRLKIPRAALRFAGDVAVDDQASDAGTVPVSIRARSGTVLDHWYFGRIVHDFAGMRAASAKLPIDYAHRDDEVLGYSDQQDASSGELVMAGVLIPFKDGDRANEVIHKAKAGLAWQGSIYFDPFDLVLEYVPEGMTSPVNGGQFEGPGVIAREWMLRGVAICPYGYDPNTSVQLSNPGDAETVAVTFTERPTMPQSRTKPAPNRHDRRKAAALSGKKAKPATKLATKRPATKPAGKARTKFEADAELEDDDEAAELEGDEEADPEADTEVADEAEEKDCDCPEGEECDCEEEGEDPEAEEPVEEMEADEAEEMEADEEAGKQSAKGRKGRRGKLSQAHREARRFITAFGPQGGQWFADGLTFAEAQSRFNKSLRDENAKLQKRVAEQSAQLNALRGESDPVSFTPEEHGKKKGADKKAISGLTTGAAKFAAALKLPK